MSADDTPITIKFGIDLSFAINDYEDEIEGPPRAEWEQMSASEREAYLHNAAQEMLHEMCTAWAEVVE